MNGSFQFHASDLELKWFVFMFFFFLLLKVWNYWNIFFSAAVMKKSFVIL